MKYARRSVSDQDIRRYEMFSQVRCAFRSREFIAYAYTPIRTFNNLVDSETTSSSQRALTLQVLRAQPLETLGLQKTRQMMICMLDDIAHCIFLLSVARE